MIWLFAADDLNTNTVGVAWSAMIISIVNGVLLTVQMIWNRKRDIDKAELERSAIKDKLELERITARDKLEFDSTLKELKFKTLELENSNKNCEESRKRDKEELRREIEVRDKRYDDIIKLILKREEEIEAWRKRHQEKVETLESESSINKIATIKQENREQDKKPSE